MRKSTITIVVLLLLTSILYSQGTGTPSTLRVRTDANGYLIVTSAAQTNPITTSIFTSTRLKTDASNNLQVILSGTVTPTFPMTVPASTCAAPSFGLSGGVTTGIAFTATPSILNCISGTAITTLISNALMIGNGTPNLGAFNTVLTIADVDLGQGGAIELLGNRNAAQQTTSSINFLNQQAAASNKIIARFIGIVSPSGDLDSGSWIISLADDAGTLASRLAVTPTTLEIPATNSFCFGTIFATDSCFLRLDTNSIGVASGDAFGLASKAWIRTAPITPVACTSPTIVNSNGTASFQIDVGTTCAGVTTLTVVMPAVITSYKCDISNLTNNAISKPDMSASTATLITFTNYSRTTGVAADWTDGDDVSISCTGR